MSIPLTYQHPFRRWFKISAWLVVASVLVFFIFPIAGLILGGITILFMVCGFIGACGAAVFNSAADAYDAQKKSEIDYYIEQMSKHKDENHDH